jgi:hypothetical protein
MAEEESRHTDEEEKDVDDVDVVAFDVSGAHNDDASSTATTANTIPTDTVDMM